MTLTLRPRSLMAFALAVAVDGLLAFALNGRLLSPATPFVNPDDLLQALVLLGIGTAVTGAACQFLAGPKSLAPYGVVAALLGIGLVVLHAAPGDLKLFVMTLVFAGAAMTLFAADAMDRVRRFL